MSKALKNPKGKSIAINYYYYYYYYMHNPIIITSVSKLKMYIFSFFVNKYANSKSTPRKKEQHIHIYIDETIGDYYKSRFKKKDEMI